MAEPGYDPLQLAKAVEEKVVRGVARKYYRFRAAAFYGGVVTGDVVGCNLRCIFCWTGKPRDDPGVGFFVEPEEAYERMVRLARRGVRYVRLSAGEPTLGREHLLKLLELFEQDGRFIFILETNGVLIGADKSYAKALSRYRNLHVRVSVKACSAELFHRLTGAKPSAWELQLKALKHLVDYGVSCHVAFVASFGTEDCWASFLERLREVDPALLQTIEPEVITLYPHVEARLRRAGVWPHTYYHCGRLVKLPVTPDGFGVKS